MWQVHHHCTSVKNYDIQAAVFAYCKGKHRWRGQSDFSPAATDTFGYTSSLREYSDADWFQYAASLQTTNPAHSNVCSNSAPHAGVRWCGLEAAKHVHSHTRFHEILLSLCTSQEEREPAMVSDQSLINTQKGALWRPPTSTNWAQLHGKSKGQRWLPRWYTIFNMSYTLHVLYYSIFNRRRERRERRGFIVTVMSKHPRMLSCVSSSLSACLLDEVHDCPGRLSSSCSWMPSHPKTTNNIHTCLLKMTVNTARLHSLQMSIDLMSHVKHTEQNKTK